MHRVTLKNVVITVKLSHPKDMEIAEEDNRNRNNAVHKAENYKVYEGWVGETI